MSFSEDFCMGSLVCGKGDPPIVVAEMSGNHGGSLDHALQIVDHVAKAGADAVKLQTYTADTMTLNIKSPDFTVADPNSLWFGRNMYDLYREAHTPWSWHEPIMERARENGLLCFSSPFDDSAVDFLEQLDVPCYKIASFECVDLPLVARVARTGKPVIISTGMATVSEISEAVEVARINGCKQLMLLKCTSNYPSSPENSNLSAIPVMRELFSTPVGLSDHTLGMGVPIASVAMGAKLIEKHVCLNRDIGVDAAFSLTPDELSIMVQEVKRAWLSIGQSIIKPTDSEIGARYRRRSLYIGKDMVAGERLTADCLRRIRPGKGLSPKYYDLLLGKPVSRNVKAGEAVDWGMVLGPPSDTSV